MCRHGSLAGKGLQDNARYQRISAQGAPRVNRGKSFPDVVPLLPGLPVSRLGLIKLLGHGRHRKNFDDERFTVDVLFIVEAQKVFRKSIDLFRRAFDRRLDRARRLLRRLMSRADGMLTPPLRRCEEGAGRRWRESDTSRGGKKNRSAPTSSRALVPSNSF
jgi:hypothetical protein